VNADRTATVDAIDAAIAHAADTARHDPEAAHDELVALVARCEHGTGLATQCASARYALARVMVLLGRAEGALVEIESAARLWRSSGAIDDAIRTNLGRMNVLDDLGRHTDAIDVGNTMIDELHGRDGDLATWMRAAAHENLGVANGYLGRPAPALAHYEAAAAAYEQLGATEDLARASANVGIELNELGRPMEAIDALRVACTHFENDGDLTSAARCHTNMCEAWTAAGRYVEAFASLAAADAILAGLDRTTDWMLTQLQRARCLETLRLDTEALDLIESLVEPIATAGLTRQSGEANLLAASMLLRADRGDEARAALSVAIATFERCAALPRLATAHLVSAQLDSDPAAAVERAIALLAGGERPAELCAAYLTGAEIAETTDPARAELLLESARREIERAPLPRLRWRWHHRAGRLHRRAGRRGDARAEFALALDLIDSIRSTLDRDRARQRFDGADDHPSDDLIELLLDGDEIMPAFAVSDRWRARGLLDPVTGVGPTPTTTPELVSTYDRLLGAGGHVAGALAIDARRLERSTSRPIEIRPETGGDGATPTLPANTIVFQTIGDEIAAFVSADGDDGSIGAVRKVCDRRAVQASLAQLAAQRRRFEHRDAVGRHRDAIDAATDGLMARLHEQLLAPLGDRIAGDRPLVIVPDGEIATVPFAALRDRGGYVVERQSVRTTPSITIDRQLAARARTLGRVLAIGTDDATAPMAAVEAERIAGVWSALDPRAATLRVGPDATVEAITSGVADHDVIHVAGHGLFRHDAPEFSAIRLADRWLTAAEAARWPLDGHLVVLSACDTGRGPGRGERDPVGFVRAFLRAGAAGVVVNLWAADDESTTIVMTAMHERLARSIAPADALREAQVAAIALHPNPYLWGSAALVGSPTGITPSPLAPTGTAPTGVSRSR
jgi:CHAT domain-containing protein/tetratricopeptide (TPR) repeat protein